MPFQLTEQQSAVVENRGGALLVSAAAGSGKTRVLVERLLTRVEREGHDIDRFLVITFTNAAAAELRGRIAQELSDRLARDPGNAHLRRQTVLVYKARICTIDALCIDLLRQYGHLLDTDPDFRICDRAEGATIALRVLDELMDRRYEHMAEYPGFAQLVESTLTGRDDVQLMNMVLDIRTRIQSHPDPARWLAEHRRDFRAVGVDDVGQTLWGQAVLAHVARQAEYWQEELCRLIELAAADPVTDANYGASLSQTAEQLRALRGITGWEEMRAHFPIVFPRAGGKRGADEAIKKTVTERRKRCAARMSALHAMVDTSGDEVLDELRGSADAMEALFDLVGEFDAAYFREKVRSGVLEFSDAEHLTVKLLELEQVRKVLQEQFCEIMVDEYQDTNEVQNTLFDALSQQGKNLFFVGDVKQSIYRFRLADPTIFLKKYEQWPHAARAREGQARKLVLSSNFRSRPQVLHGVNFVFERIMSRECGEMDYTAEHALVPGKEAENEPDYRVELDVIDLPSEEDAENAVDKNLVEARFVARRITRLLREEFAVEDAAGGKRPVRPEDIAVIMRAPGPVLRHYVRALSEAGIPVQTDGGDDFFQTTEISVALSLLQIIDNPRQDVPLLSVLRSPVFAFTPDRLAQIRAGSRNGDFYSAMQADAGEDCAEFLEQLRRLRFRAGEMPTHRLIERLYDQTHLSAIFGAMPGGAERQANLAVLREQAARFESAGHKGLFAFLTHLGRMRQRGEKISGAAPGGEGVHILSTHRSKGLEFPVVFLCGLGRQFNKTDAAAPILFHPQLGLGPKHLERGEGWSVQWPTLARQAVNLQMEREMKAEEMRLLYVAMTRAKEKLIMTVGLGRAQQVLARLASDAGTVAAGAVAAANTPGQWLLLCAMSRPEAHQLRVEEGICPVTTVNDPPWDIRLLHAEDYEQPLYGSAAAVQGEEPAVKEERQQMEQILRWKYPHAAAVELPSKFTATQLKGRTLDTEAAEGTERPRTDRQTAFERPDFAARKLGLTAPQRGTAMHKVLQYLDFDRTGSAEEIGQEIARLVQEQFITEQEGQAADPDALAAFFAGELGQQLLHAPVRNREYKFSILVPAGELFPEAPEEQILFQGVVDCWFEDENGITVVDFKTDRTPRPEQYRMQVEGYAGALEELLGRPVSRKVLYFLSTGDIFFL